MTVLRATGVYRDRRVLSLFFFGFSSGLPLALTGATLAAWLTQAGTALATIGFAALVGFAYNLKFVGDDLGANRICETNDRSFGFPRPISQILEPHAQMQWQDEYAFLKHQATRAAFL